MTTRLAFKCSLSANGTVGRGLEYHYRVRRGVFVVREVLSLQVQIRSMRPMAGAPHKKGGERRRSRQFAEEGS